MPDFTASNNKRTTDRPQRRSLQPMRSSDWAVWAILMYVCVFVYFLHFIESPLAVADAICNAAAAAVIHRRRCGSYRPSKISQYFAPAAIFCSLTRRLSARNRVTAPRIVVTCLLLAVCCMVVGRGWWWSCCSGAQLQVASLFSIHNCDILPLTG